jgi:hypothetical protein
MSVAFCQPEVLECREPIRDNIGLALSHTPERRVIVPWSFTIDVERHVVYSRGWGDLTDEALLDHQGRLALDPGFQANFSQLIDFTGVTSVAAVTTGGVRAVAQRHLYGSDARRAIVAPDSAVFGLARMFETVRDLLGAKEQIRVFRNLEEARAWLGLPPEDAV